MKLDHSIQCVCDGVKAYLRAFALADNMDRHIENGLEWITPKPGFGGPSLVFGVTAGEADADSRIGEWIYGIRAGAIPSFWFVSPDWAPANIVDLLLEKGFRDMSNPDEPELAMSMDLTAGYQWPSTNDEITVKKVRSPEEFVSWCGIANAVLHGSPMVTVEHYSAWLTQEGIRMYIAQLGQTPIATAATIRSGNAASLEFVATCPEYRKRGAATAACLHALKELRREGVETVTLRAFHAGKPIYERLGFQVCYPTVGLTFG